MTPNKTGSFVIELEDGEQGGLIHLVEFVRTMLKHDCPHLYKPLHDELIDTGIKHIKAIQPLVLCGECKYSTQLESTPGRYWCEHLGCFVTADFFCKDGVKA